MCRFFLALALVLALCSSINAQSPDPVEVNDPDVESQPLAFAGPDDPAISFFTEGASNNYFGFLAGAANPTGTNNSFFGGGTGYCTTTGSENSFFGGAAGFYNTIGSYNSFFGGEAGQGNTSGNWNSFFGQLAGYNNTTGNNNSFFGRSAGFNNTTGFDNSFFGVESGSRNTTGAGNCFFGYQAGLFNTAGSDNSFFGDDAGVGNTTGTNNSFFGAYAGFDNTTGTNNSFFGTGAGYANTTGTDNAFHGTEAGRFNLTGFDNAFVGRQAGFSNTTGHQNSFFGRSAGYSSTVENGNTFVGYGTNLHPGPDPATNPVTNATAIGYRAFVSRSNSLILGSIAGLNLAASYVNVGIGTPAPERQLHLAGPNAVFRMDRSTDTAAFIMVRTDTSGTPMKTFVVGTNASGVNQGEFIINDVGTAVGGVGNRRMTITNEGNVQFTGVVTAADFASPSSIALKTNVRTLDHAVATVNRLRGVRFDWKDSGKPAVGVIAEEVAQVLPEVVAHEDDQVTGVNYAKLVPLLIEAVKEQQATIQRQQQTIEHQGARLEALERLLNQR